jgi:hypothetical protein
MNNIIKKAPIIGFVRYSQKIKFGDSKKERDVFESEYFEYRYNIFKNVTLKSFQNQTNTNFVLLLLHSENMPAHYKERFLQIEKANAFLHNIFLEDTQESFNDALINSINYATSQSDTIVTFRIDNDDAVQNNFIEKLSGFLKNDFIGFSLSIPLIYIVKRISHQLYMLQERYYPANSIGLGFVTNKECYKTVLNLGDHHLVNNGNSLILLTKSENGGLQTINGENELNSIDHTRSITLSKEELEDYLFKKNMDNLDLDCLYIYEEKNLVSKYSFKTVVQLFTPPIYKLILNKIKALFFIKRE